MTLPWLPVDGGALTKRRELNDFVRSVAPLGFVAQFAFLSLFFAAPLRPTFASHLKTLPALRSPRSNPISGGRVGRG